MHVRLYRRADSPYYYVTYKYNGRRRRYSLGVREKYSADLIAREIERKLALGKDPAAEIGKRTLLSEFLDKYLKYAERINAPSTYKIKKYWAAFFIRTYGDRPLSAITKESLENYRLKRRDKVSGPAVNREFCNLRNALTLAVEWDYLEVNPATGIKNYRLNPARVRYLTRDEYERLIAACPPDLKTIVITAVNTGLRRGELLDLEVSDIDFGRRLLTVKKGKNQEGRVLPINDNAAKALWEAIDGREKGYIFAPPNLWGRFKKTVEKAGIKDFNFHDLRHTFASWLVMSGVDITTVNKLLGHKTIQMTMRYAHLSPGYLADAVAQLSPKGD